MGRLRKKGWTLEDHQHASRLLREMDALLSEFFRPPLNYHRRKSTSAPLLRIDRHIKDAKSRFEDEMFRTLKGSLPEDATEVYYPR